MRLKNNYYKLLEARRQDVATGIYHVALLTDCDVYRGHFPQEPICPGVFNMQMVKECTEAFVGKKLHQTSVKQCRLVSLMTPTKCSEVDVRIDVLSASESSFTIKASIFDQEQIYMELLLSAKT